MSDKKFYKMISAICKEQNIKLEILSFGLIQKLSKNGINKYIIGKHFDNNSANINTILDDKYALYETLSSANIPIIEHKMIFNPKYREKYMSKENLWKEVKQYAKKYNNNIVIKSNIGNEGKQVFREKKYTNICKCINSLFKSEKSLSLCPFYQVDLEYRVIFLNGEVELIFSKERPYVIGNGINTILELFNSNKKDLSKYCTLEKIDNVSLEYIPKKDEKINLTWKHNLYRGAIPRIITDNEKIKKIKQLVDKISKCIDMYFVSIDVLELSNGTFIVLEINTSVTMNIFSELVEDGDEIAKKMYSKAIKEYFK